MIEFESEKKLYIVLERPLKERETHNIIQY